MKKWLLFICLVLFSNIAMAQSKPYFATEQVYPNGFIAFKSKKAKKAAQNINQYLQLSLFQNLLENGADSNLKWITKIHINDKRILSISVQNSEENIRHFVFNSATGAMIDLPEMINVNGIAFIRRKIIKTYQGIGSSHSKFLEKCLKEDIHNFKIGTDTLTVYTEKCTDQDSANLGQQLPIGHIFLSGSMVNYLTNYGQAMFGLEKKLKMKKMRSFATPGLYAGKQNNEAVVLLLEAPFEKQVAGVLYYVKSKKAVPVSGSFKNNRLDANIEQGKLSLIISAGQVQGTIKQGNKIVSNLIMVKQ